MSDLIKGFLGDNGKFYDSYINESLASDFKFHLEKSIERNGWISVDDRLPEDDDHIIMCTESGDRFSGRGRVLVGNLNHPEPSVGKITRYTHWQLMPPAPNQ